MHWSLSGRYVCAFVVGGLVAFSPVGDARAQLATNDAQANQTLLLILQELQTQTALMNTQSTTLEEIKQLNENILDAICGRSNTVRQAVTTAFDPDATNVQALAFSVFDGDLPTGVATPTPGDLKSMLKTAKQMYGTARQLYNRAQGAINQVESIQRRIDQGGGVTLNDIRRAGRVLRTVQSEAMRQRNFVHSNAIQNSLTFSNYSLQEMPTAKGREVSMAQRRTAAKCLREDVAALNETTTELLKRINHLTMLIANENAVNASKELIGLPVFAGSVEDDRQ